MPLEIFLERTNVYIYIELSLTISVHKDIFDLTYNDESSSIVNRIKIFI